MTRVAVTAAILAGCYHPAPEGGAPCETSADCPPGLTCEQKVCTPPGGTGDGAVDGCEATHCSGDQLVVCGTATDCIAGCGETGGPHCQVLVPSNGLTPDLLTDATADVVGDRWRFDTDDGRIRGNGGNTLRGAGTGVINGIGFQVVEGLGVFTAHSFTIGGTESWSADGANPVVLYAATSITVAGTFDAGASSSFSGPGGFDGGSTNSNTGCRGHYGLAYATGFGEGGGGAGGVTTGGDGAPSNMSTFGAGGPQCDSHPTTIPLTGASGGGAGGYDAVNGTLRGGAGGGGGGGVALVAMESVTITGAVGAPGGGGQTLATGDGGGGGGGGGAVLVEAPIVTVSGAVTANGGGGAAPSMTAGTRGHLTDDTVAGGGVYNGRSGGRGCANTTPPAGGQNYTDNATTPTISRGGGGGGACGRIELKARTLTTTGAIESPAAAHSQAQVQ